MNKFTGHSASYLAKLAKLLNELDHSSMDNAVPLVEDAWRNGKQIITLGNGGSSLTALHFINDWNKSVFMQGGLPFRGRSLGQVYISLRIFTASMFPSLTASISGVLPQGSN